MQIIFIVNDDSTNEKSLTVKHFMAISSKGDPILTHSALHDWYTAEKKDYKTFATKYPLNEELAMQGEKLRKMHEWCTKTDIQFTPTFFINGRQLPDSYKLKDLHFLVD